MDNHQVDVAKALSDQEYLLASSPEYLFPVSRLIV